MYCRLQESNQGHKDFQSFALPTELKRHCIYCNREEISRFGRYMQEVWEKRKEVFSSRSIEKLSATLTE